ncbi:uncharacterized protein LOC123008729 [Tribolium madens]|uniref:uncharacterized protein LOC123008729 n=1 Tax=Tribolium madens TaxID=41895 RepID=UPI001CF74223|nr:uncharacterized protein LOC123008729 [Tribolium madens]
MFAGVKMWNLMSIRTPDPKFGQKGCFHTSFPLGAVASDKQFPLFKPELKSTVCHNYNSRQKTDLLENSSQMDSKIIKNPEINQVCNSKKKKKKRRRRRKKTKNHQTKNTVQEIPVQRQRQVSVCESEDSFVIFFGEEEERLSEVSEATEGFDSCDSIVPIKKVRFASDSRLCEIHPMIMWSYAYQAARKGPWEEYARDRDRFNKRVRKTEAIIGHVFTDEHRSKIYQQRFASL